MIYFFEIDRDYENGQVGIRFPYNWTYPQLLANLVKELVVWRWKPVIREKRKIEAKIRGEWRETEAIIDDSFLCQNPFCNRKIPREGGRARADQKYCSHRCRYKCDPPTKKGAKCGPKPGSKFPVTKIRELGN